MKNRKKIFSMLIVAVLFSGTVFANGASEEKSGSQESEKITLHMLYNDTDEKVEEEMDYVMSRLPKVMANVKVELDMSPGDAQSYETKVRTLIAGGGEDLDVWWERGGSWATSILNSNSALPLDSYLNESGYWNDVIPSAKLPAADGHFYSCYFEDISYEIMVYNKAIFAKYGLEVPKTVDDLKHIVEVLAKTDITPITVGAKDGWCAAMMLEGFAYSVDPQITKKIVDGDANFSDKPYTEAAQVIKDLFNMNAFSKNVALTGIGEALPLFESGKAAMMANGSWAITSGAAKMGNDFGYFYYPVINSSDIDNYGKNIAGGVKQNSGFMVYSGTKHPKEAAKLAQMAAELRCEYVYTKLGNPFTIYNPEKMEWKKASDLAEPVEQLANDMTQFKFVYGLVQDVMPTAAASAGVMQSCSKFMINSSEYPISSFLSDMNKAANEK